MCDIHKKSKQFTGVVACLDQSADLDGLTQDHSHSAVFLRSQALQLLDLVLKGLNVRDRHAPLEPCLRITR